MLELGLLIDADVLVKHLDDSNLIIVDLTRQSVYEQLHLPKAIHVKPKQLLYHQELVSGLLPDAARLQSLINDLQITPEHHVVAYDDEGGAWASRLLWNLHCAGFHQTSLLNGGIHAWLTAGYPTTIVPHVAMTDLNTFTVDLSKQDEYRIQYKALKENVAQQNIQIWDCRTFDEYTGIKRSARLAGHLPNAKHYEWSTALDRKNYLKLHSLDKIRQQLESIGFNLNEPVVVYCQSHHRSAFAYMIGRLLHWQIYAYDGAWSEWGNILSNPTVMGENPL